MANSNTKGFGLIAAGTLGATPATGGQNKYKIDAGYATSIFQGNYVQIDSAGGANTNPGYIITGQSAVTNPTIGVLNGVFYNAATTEKPTFQNYYSQVTPANSEDITAFVIDNPFQQYLAGTSAALGANNPAIEAQMGRTMGSAANAGSTLNGQSTNTLTVASIHDINNTWRLLRIAEDPSNEDGTAANCTVVVVANKSQWFGTGTVSA